MLTELAGSEGVEEAFGEMMMGITCIPLSPNVNGIEGMS